MRISRSGEMISQIRNIGGRVFERLLTESGVSAFTGPQGRILDALWKGDDIPVKEIAARTGLAPTTLTTMLDYLQKAGLICRVPGHPDRRTVHIRLTGKARELQTAYEQLSAKMTDVYFKDFSDDEIDLFESMLARVLRNVKEEDHV